MLLKILHLLPSFNLVLLDFFLGGLTLFLLFLQDLIFFLFSFRQRFIFSNLNQLQLLFFLTHLLNHFFFLSLDLLNSSLFFHPLVFSTLFDFFFSLLFFEFKLFFELHFFTLNLFNFKFCFFFLAYHVFDLSLLILLFHFPFVPQSFPLDFFGIEIMFQITFFILD